MNYIFDFDGTIVDSFDTMVGVFNDVVRTNDNPLTKEEISKLRKLSSRKALKKLGIRWWQYPKVVTVGIPEYLKRAPEQKVFEGMPELFKELKNRGDRLFIVTSMTHSVVEPLLRKNKIDGYFEYAFCGASLFNKSRYIRRLIKKYKLKRRQTFYIGDETRDINAGRLAGVKQISVTWGFNDVSILRKRRPTYIAHNPKAILKIKKV